MLSSLPFSPALPTAPVAAPPAAPSSGHTDGAAPGGFSQALDQAKAPPPERTAASRGRGNGPTGGPDKAPRTLPGKPELSSLPEAADTSTVKGGAAVAAAADDKAADEKVQDLLAQLQGQAQLQLLTPQGAAAAQVRAAAGGGAAAGDGAAADTTAAEADGGGAASRTDLLGALSGASSRLADSLDAKGGSAEKGHDKGNDTRAQTHQLQDLLAGAVEERAALTETLSAASSDQGQPVTRAASGDGAFVLNALPAGAALAAAPGSSPSAPAEARLPARPGSPDFAPQLGAQLSTFVRDGVEHARLHLNPAEMGPVSVRIQLDGQTAMVHLSADNAQTRQALEQSMPQLASQLREAGLTLTGGGVSEQPRQDTQAATDDAGGRGNSRGSRGGEGGRDDGARNDLALATARLPQRRGVVDLVA